MAAPTTAYDVRPFHLVSVPVSNVGEAKPAPQPTNHVVVIDCSGSMWNDLPLIRTQLKAKLPQLIAEGDTVSIVWFSGRGEFGTLVKGEPVATLKDLNDLGRSIDRWLRPVGLTGFREPIEEAARVAKELGGVCSLFFMSDGYDNQWMEAQILQAVGALSTVFASTTFVEYGFYCNHPLMVSMAESAGGSLILNEDFRKYEPSFEAAMGKRPLGAKRVKVDIKDDVVRSFAFALDGGSLLTFKVEAGQVNVPEHLTELWYVTTGERSNVEIPDFQNPTEAHRNAVSAAYAAVALYSQRMASEVVFPLLRNLCDVEVIKRFSGCFGKQKYAEFVEATSLAAFDPKLRYRQGYDPKAVPNDDAFTVLDLLRIISEEDGNFILFDSDAFRYNRIGRQRVQDVGLSEDQVKELEQLQREIKVAKGKLLEDAQSKVDALQALRVAPLKFEADPMPGGVPVEGLVYNETRPNVSVMLRREGTVDLTARKSGGHTKVPDAFRTFTFRSYSIIKDGLVNVETLPLRLSPTTLKRLRDAGIPDAAIGTSDDGSVSVIQLRELPVINRAMVRATSAKRFFELEYELTVARAAQKVYNGYIKESFEGGRTSEGFKVLYGEDEATWLKGLGITDYSGFSPGGKQAEKQDVYMGKELHVLLKGLSTLPSLKDVKDRLAAGKSQTTPGELMLTYVKEVEGFLSSSAYKKSLDQPKVFKAWLEGQASVTKKKVRALLYEVSQIRFSVVVGQVWFTEFSSLDQNQLDFVFAGKNMTGTVTMKEIEVAI